MTLRTDRLPDDTTFDLAEGNAFAATGVDPAFARATGHEETA